MSNIKKSYFSPAFCCNIFTDRLCSPWLLIAQETALYVNNRTLQHKAFLVQPFVKPRFVVPLEKDSAFFCPHMVNFLAWFSIFEKTEPR